MERISLYRAAADRATGTQLRHYVPIGPLVVRFSLSMINGPNVIGLVRMLSTRVIRVGKHAEH